MKMSSLRVGMIFKELREKANYAVIDIIEDSINDYSREVVTLGKLGANKAITIDFSELKNPKRWAELKGAVTAERLIREKFTMFGDGSEEIISRELISEEHAVKGGGTRIVEKGAKAILRPNVTNSKTVVHQIDPKMAAQHKQAKENSTNTMTDALANAKPMKKKKNVSNQNFHTGKRQPKATVEIPRSVVDQDFYYRLMRYKYTDLDIIGMLLLAAYEEMGKNFLDRHLPVKPKGRSKVVHQQEYDRFKNDEYSLYDIRKMGNRLVATKPSEVGTPVSNQQIVRRMMRAILHFGSNEERVALNLHIIAKSAVFSSGKRKKGGMK